MSHLYADTRTEYPSSQDSHAGQNRVNVDLRLPTPRGREGRSQAICGYMAEARGGSGGTKQTCQSAKKVLQDDFGPEKNSKYEGKTQNPLKLYNIK